MLIVENSIFELINSEHIRESLLRILWVSEELNQVIVIEITDKKNMKYPFSIRLDELINEINEGMAQIIEIDPDLRMSSPDEDYLKKHRLKRDLNWDVVKDIVFQEPDIYLAKKRGSLVAKTVEKTGRSKKEIYRLLKRYWFYGKSINGLIGDYFDCGATGMTRNYSLKSGPKSKDGNQFIVKEKDKNIFEKAVLEFHQKRKMKLTYTYRHMCEKYYNSGYYRKNGVLVPIMVPEEMPTLRQFTYWYHKKFKLAEKYANSHGERKAEINMRAFQGDSEERAVNVGYLFEIDSTPADVILVSEDRKTIIGSPTLYIVKDVFSRLIVGFHVSLSHASSLEQMVALENTGANKVEFCKQYGIGIEEEDWPCAHLPRFLAGDRGELKSKLTENLININVDVANAPSYRGDLKPYVEQHFRLTNQKIRELLTNFGAKPARLIDRGDHDPSRDASLTIYEFTQFMILQIIAFNKSALPRDYFITREMFEDNVELSPLDVWNWGKRKRILHEVPRNILRYNLLPKEKVTVTRWGIKFEGMYYTNETALKEGWFQDCLIDGQRKVKVSFDPRNVSSIFLRLKSGRLEQCFLTSKYKEYEGLHLEDVKTIMKYRREQLNKKAKEELQHQAELHAFTENLIGEAKKETKASTSEMSHNERKKNKRETRKAESREKGSREAWTATNYKSNENNENRKIVSLISSLDDGINKNVIHEKFSLKNKSRRRNNESE